MPTPKQRDNARRDLQKTFGRAEGYKKAATADRTTWNYGAERQARNSNIAASVKAGVSKAGSQISKAFSPTAVKTESRQAPMVVSQKVSASSPTGPKPATMSPRPKPKPARSNNAKSVQTPKGPSSFKEAFAAARKKGVGTTFKFNGKSYAAVTKDDLKKVGHKSLRSFLNARKKK